MSVADWDDDEAFLIALDAAEAAALDSSKRRRLSTTSSSSTPSTPPAAPEGPYLAALKGSHSSTWKQQLQYLGYAHKRPDGSKPLAPGTGGALVASGSCFKCGDPGHWARECPQSVPNTGGGGQVGGGGGGGGYANAGVEVEDKACPCGAGSCLVLTSNTLKNPGRKFYKCPLRGGGSCGIFKWCDEQQPRVGAPLQASAQYQADSMSSIQNPSQRSSSSCFKCGQENHWARDCPNQSSDPYPDRGGRPIASASSPGACYNCGRPGHWSRDCPTSNSGGGGGGTGGTSCARSSSAMSSWNSQRY